MIGSNDRCFICGSMQTLETHHCLHGIRRKMADKYGLTVRLCRSCHMNVHDHGINDKYLEQTAQVVFEAKHGHQKWMDVFGKNYAEV